MGGPAQPRRLDLCLARSENPVMAGEKSSSDARKQRLAKALKANIARRKAQSRAQDGARPAGETAPEPPPDEDGCPN